MSGNSLGFCLCSLLLSSRVELSLLHLALDLCRDRLQCWGAAGGLHHRCLEATEIGVLGRDLEPGQQPDFWSHISERSTVSSQASSVHCHLSFHCLSWTGQRVGISWDLQRLDWGQPLWARESREAGRERHRPLQGGGHL